jgi:hypothetical protein
MGADQNRRVKEINLENQSSLTDMIVRDFNKLDDYES